MVRRHAATYGGCVLMGQCRATPQALGSRYKLVETLPVGVALSYYERAQNDGAEGSQIGYCL